MSEKTLPNLNSVAETLLIPLYAWAVESQRPDALLRDEKAVEIVRQLDYDFERIKLHGHDGVAVILRMREFDRQACEFMTRYPDSVVMHIGCGLDTRFERLDKGRVEWFDLDLPEVIDRGDNPLAANQLYHLISESVFSDKWLEAVSPYFGRPFLFMAEGVFPYFAEIQIQALVLKLRDCFPGAELVCDAHTPFVVWADNLQLAGAGASARLHWGLKHGKDVEGWGEGILMLEEWFYFDHPEPRFNAWRWMGRIPLLSKSTGIFHYRLGLRPSK
jgi:O-methyltransferase involved in polyketide biosynthesis